ncbi:agmatinase [Pseudothermotoga thermarum]|uniref:Agmatinase n=1 Tax=Pseudothermotoga thermarum DSM 5069 TaxID=688269 RepID=F7YXI2_9THEM|nr:agmatinase [Pseudothermotoga thermarum]AEH50623.1 agmatinase [Pseudothermotoga thermarum DSM 5069]
MKRYVIVGVPFDGTTSFMPSARYGPTLVRHALKHLLEPYVFEYDVDLAKINVFDSGDAEIVAGDVIKTLENVAKHIQRNFVESGGDFLIVLGGEHTVSYAPVNYLKPKSFLVFDTHFDLCDEYQGTKWSHACVTRRIHELGIQVLLVGVRSAMKQEIDYARENKISWIHAKDFSLEKFIQEVKKLPDPVYLSIDIDVFDIGLVDDTGTPEPGGLNFWQLLGAFEWLFSNKRVVGFDIVEVAGTSLASKSAITAGKLLKYLIALCEVNQKA